MLDPRHRQSLWIRGLYGLALGATLACGQDRGGDPDARQIADASTEPTVDAVSGVDAAPGVDSASAIDGGASADSSTPPPVDSVTFSPGSLPAGATVSLEVGTAAATLAAFDDGAGTFDVQDRAATYLRISTGTHMPVAAATVELGMPAGFRVASDDEARLFARVHAANDDEVLDAFEPLERLTPTGPGRVAAVLPPWAFTAARSSDGTVEAVVLIATTPAVSSLASRSPAGRLCENPTASCPIACMHTPLLRTLRIKRGLNLDPDAGVAAFHPGTDLRAEAGVISAVAVGAGTVVESRFSANLPADCNFPMDCANKGMGETVLLDVPGVGRVRYMHLTAGSRTIADCCTGPGGGPCRGTPDLEPCEAAVAQGDVLGTTGNTGFSAAPHLHMEVVNDGGRIDPGPCILPPDYRGEARTVWKDSGNGFSFDMTASADVTFKWSEEEGRYVGEGTWAFDMRSVDPMCVVTVTGGSGAIERDGASLFLGGLMNELLKSSYFLGNPIPKLPYLATGGAFSPVTGRYVCRSSNGTQSGMFTWSMIVWLPFIISEEGNGFFIARPDPYQAEAPYEDFEETDIPDFPGSLNHYTSSWKLSARKSE